MANVLSEAKRQQVIALGRLGRPLGRIEEAVQIRRETASKYLKEAGIPVRPSGRWGRGAPKPANEVKNRIGLMLKIREALGPELWQKLQAEMPRRRMMKRQFQGGPFGGMVDEEIEEEIIVSQ